MAQELTFNISEDRRKLQGPVEAKNFNLKFGTDGVAITHGNPKQWVQGRIGDNELKQVFVNITEGENNTPKDVAGLFLAFVGIIHDKDGRPHRVVDYKHSTTIDVEHGRFRFDFPDQAFTVAGEYQQAFFMLVKEGPGGGCVATMEFDMQVMANFVFTDLVPEDYITPFNDTVDQLMAACKKFKDDTAADEAKFKQELEDAYAKFQKDTNTQFNNFKDATNEDLANFKKANADDIAKFKQQYADAVKAKEDELQSKVDNYTDKLDTLLKDLNQQGIDTSTMLTDLRSQMTALQDKIKNDHLFTQAEVDAFEQSLKKDIEQLLKKDIDSLTNQVKTINQNSSFFRLADYKNDDNSWQDAMDAILQLSNATFNIALPKSQAITTDVVIKKPGVTLTGGTFAGAELVLDYPPASSNTMCSITGVRFSGDNDAIKLVSAPYVRVANNYFENTGVAIKVASDVKKDGFQPSRRVIITGNHFNGCSYGFYAKDATNTFGSAGDVIFTNNQVDVKVGGIHSENVDGHTITNNVFYMPGNAEKDMDKLDNIYLQNAHFTVIQGNSCFEAGRDGIRLIDCTNINVLDNQIDWPGQNTPGSGVYIDYNLDGEIMGRVSGNQIVYPTKYGVETPTSRGTLDVSDNMIVATGDNRYYYGSSSLDDFAPHYNVYAPNISGSKFSHNFSFAVNNNQSQWLINNTKMGQNYFEDILNYSGRVSNKDFARSDVVYRAVLHSNLSASYQMTKDDFDTKVGGPDVGAYMIYIIPWSESATAEVYIAAYSGGITTQGSLTKVYGGQSKTQISVDGDTISFTGTGLIVITAI